MLYKTGRQELEFFKKETEVLWGCVHKMEVIIQKSDKNGNMTEYFRVTNEDGAKKDFKVHGFDQTLAGFNEFSRIFSEIRTGKSLQLLAHYMTLLTSSHGFLGHNKDIHERHGFLLSNLDEEKDRVNDLGGSVKELETFISAAKSSAMFAENYSKVLDSISASTKKKTKVSAEKMPPKNPKSLSTQLNTAFNKEINRSDGMEAEYSRSFMGRIDILLSNIIDDDQCNLSPVCSHKVNSSASR